MSNTLKNLINQKETEIEDYLSNVSKEEFIQDILSLIEDCKKKYSNKEIIKNLIRDLNSYL